MKKNKYRIPNYILNNEYEFILIERKVEGTADASGQPSITWTTVSNNTKAVLQPLSGVAESNYRQMAQGSVTRAIKQAFIESSVDLQVRDRITDENDDEYVVLDVKAFKTHKEAIVEIEEGTIE